MKNPPQLSSQQRKQILVLQGQVFRSGLVLAQHDVRAALEPKSLLRQVLGEAVESGTEAARKLLSLQSLLDGRLAILLPLAGKGLGLLARRSVLRPLALVLVTGGLGYMGWRLWQQRSARRQARPNSHVEADTDPLP